MGRHHAPEEAPPPKDKPRYRFLVALAAIVMLALASMALVATVFPEHAPQAEASEDPGQAGNPFPEISPGHAGQTGQSPSPGPTETRAEFVTGTFAISQEWGDGFIGVVSILNATPRAESWQVQLTFPATVGELRSRWLSDGPGETAISRDGQVVTFTGQSPLASGAHVGLFFQFAKGAGSPAPTSCLINSHACT